MSEAFKICPICGSLNPPQALACAMCGTDLRAVEIRTAATAPRNIQPDYDYRYGETDLLEADLRQTGRAYLVGGILVFSTVMVVGFIALVGAFLASIAPDTPDADIPVVTYTHTPRPTIRIETVTPAPPTETYTPIPSSTPTPTVTPTPEPCMQTVASGDDLISLTYRCGHRSMDVISLVLEINNLTDASHIQIGQVLEIPWPTPTVDPNITPTETPTRETSANGDSLSEDDIDMVAFDPFGPTATKTLQPGVQWHQVETGENIVSIAVNYGANVEILSQLNPEITFSQCDFGMDSGGGSCLVNLYEGQLMRVPAPTATPTLPPTASGSETATPTPTATFNAPSPLNPDNRAFFERDQLVTLRWIATGTLAEGQVYRIQLQDLTTGTLYSADTEELSFILPTDWQGQDDQRHEYSWTVSVINIDEVESPVFTTPSRIFIWEGRGE